MRGLRFISLLTCLVALAACAPKVQTLGPAAATGFVEPRLEAETFVPRDSQQLGLMSWQAEEPHAILIGLHGMNDYSNAFALPGPWWAERGLTTYAIDQRGHGRSPQRGIWPAQGMMEDDLEDLVIAVRAAHPDLPVYVMGHSMGGGVVLSTMSSRDLNVDGAILAAPGVWGWQTIPFPLDAILWISAHTVPGMIVTGESLERWPTDNIEVLRAMSRDELMLIETRVDAVYGVVGLMSRAWRGAQEMPSPVLVLYGENDQIIPPAPVTDVIAAMCPHRRVAIYEDGWHLLMRDLAAEQVWMDVLAFTRDPDGELPSGAETLGNLEHSCGPEQP